MALSATEIQRVLVEITPVVTHARIQKIHQPGDRVLVLELRQPGETHRLLISCEPDTARLHFAFRPLLNPASPPIFCQLLRAHVQGGRLQEIRQMELDRIVTLTVSAGQGPRTIVCALTGQTANVLLLDEQGRVLRDLNGQRHLVGQTYQPPQQRRGDSIRNRAPRFDLDPTAETSFPLSHAIEAHYDSKEEASVSNRAREERLRTLRKSLAKVLKRLNAWRDDLDKASLYRDYGRYGELLKAHLALIKPGMEQITLLDYYDPVLPEVTLPLDPSKSPLGNMNEYFKKHRKHVAADRELRSRIADGEQEADALRRELISIETGHWTPSTGRRLEAGKTSIARKSPASRRGPFRRFLSADGLPIYVGRNAAENDQLTFRFAKSDDLWLHARGTPGSHVVVRLAKGADPPPETVRDAATLALLYSDLKKSGKGDVIYTKRKWVKKAKGQAAGAVIVTQEKSLAVTLDARRLAALRQRSDVAPPG